MPDVTTTEATHDPGPTGRCSLAGCPSPALVQWQRRPTTAELAELLAAEESRRDMAQLLADPQKPAPVFGPLPDATATTIAVFACLDHAITMDAAAYVHGAACRAPHPDHLPGCDCEPEPHPEHMVFASQPAVTLSTGWTVPAPPTP